MTFRATSLSMSNHAAQYSAKFNASIAKYQMQITSGLKLHRPSEDPVGYRYVVSLTARLEELNSEAASVSDAQAKLNFGVSNLTDANNLITKAKILTQQGIQALDQAERNGLATEVENLMESLKVIALAKNAGTYLYGGTRTDAPPFSFNNPQVAGGTLDVKYNGSAQASRAHIGQAIEIDTYYSGKEVFGATDRQPTILIGKSGAKTGTGTDTLVGRATLQVKHTSTIYQPGSGISAGTDSAAKDTIIGPPGKYQLQIIDTSGDGSSGTISLNGEPPITFTDADTNLQVTGPNGQKIYVNTTAITAGFNGTVDLAANGTLSIDGGLTTLPIDFSANQTVVDSTSGKLVHINSANIETVGEDYLEFPGSSNAFQVLYELVQDLRGSRQLSSSELAQSLDRRLGELGATSDQLLNIVGQQSASLATLQQLDSRISDFQLQTAEQLNGIQATDIPTAILRMKNDQTLLEYTYAVTAEVMSVQLINFLR
jgi:flagellar hook-associated protein 3 FlgL